jgi:hypothetical protein
MRKWNHSYDVHLLSSSKKPQNSRRQSLYRIPDMAIKIIYIVVNTDIRKNSGSLESNEQEEKTEKKTPLLPQGAGKRAGFSFA